MYISAFDKVSFVCYHIKLLKRLFEPFRFGGIYEKYNVAVVGATGMVGNKFLEVLAERNLPVENYYLYASAKSAGKVIDFMGNRTPLSNSRKKT